MEKEGEEESEIEEESESEKKVRLALNIGLGSVWEFSSGQYCEDLVSMDFYLLRKHLVSASG